MLERNKKELFKSGSPMRLRKHIGNILLIYLVRSTLEFSFRLMAYENYSNPDAALLNNSGIIYDIAGA